MKQLRDEKTCGLCGLGVGRHPFTRDCGGDEKTFCCLGCMNVYTILLESGAIAGGQDVRETELFKRSLALGLISSAASDEPPLPPLPPDAPTREILLQVSGMWCSSCAWLIEHALGGERGVISAEASFASDLVKVRYYPQCLPPGRIVERIERLGYRASQYSGENEAVRTEQRDLLLRLGVAGFLYLNIMTLSAALYVGYFERIAESAERFLPLVLMALATPIVFYSAAPILRLMWQSFVHRAARMETLLGIGVLAAYFYSVAQAFMNLNGGGSHVYFDTASAIVTLVLLGKLIERNAKERMARSIAMLYRMTPKKVRLLSGGAERFVTIDALEVGDVFVIKAGERVPADGVVIEGSSHADESLLTGESVPVEKEIGDTVVAGSVNDGGVLSVRATKVGGDTTLAQIIRLVERAMSGKSDLERAVDRVSRLFTPAVIVIAILTFAVCWLRGFAGAGDSLMRAITVLVIACPCALGLATPLAITAAIGAASRRGILVSDSRALETISDVDVVIFDKTGTVTEGDFALLEIETCAESLGEPAVAGVSGFEAKRRTQVVNPAEIDLALVASLERYSEHPLGRAVVKRAEREGIGLSETRDVEIRKGQGVTGLVAGHRVFAGNRKLAESEGVVITPELEARANELQRAGRTVAFFGRNGTLWGLLVFGDRLRTEAAETIAALKRRGVKTMIVSGDAQTTTEWVATSIGVDDFIAEALPDDKTRIVERLQRDGQVVAMIGDGVNDAPALAQANLGVAIGAGSDIAMKAAAIVLMTNSLDRLPGVFDLAARTQRIVRQNLFWAFAYNTLGVGLAVTGVLNPIFAAAAMLLSSLSVIGNSLRLNAAITNNACD